MFSALPKAVFSGLAASGYLKQLASRYGMRSSESFARRFVAGENTEDAIEAARQLEQTGMMTTLDLLGESVRTSKEAADATAAYLGLMKAIAGAGVSRNISVKLTQLGMDVDHATVLDNIRRVLEIGDREKFFIRIDMESSKYTDPTLELFKTVWDYGHRNVGVVVQSYLRRSEADVRRLNAMGARVRLVKGAYLESPQAAFQQKSAVDAAFIDLMKTLLTEGTYPAIATHDPAMIEATTKFAAQQGIAKEAFEFQMLYGIRRDLQAALTGEGYRFRVYVPYGVEWFPYFMRRLGERPANIGFVVRSVLRENQ
ncbi:MAG TPA: proline dehydrogenase family protein [Vicinamibacterales bacterium]|nr:proline dehydrogenase family protein [Vicinamibacterales bacterium]